MTDHPDKVAIEEAQPYLLIRGRSWDFTGKVVDRGDLVSRHATPEDLVRAKEASPLRRSTLSWDKVGDPDYVAPRM